MLKFAGDALICMFGGSNEDVDDSVEDLALRAIQCGIEIQTNLKEYDSNEGFKLTLHIGIGAGDLHAVFVGGVEDSWEFLVIGDPLLQLKTAVDNSQSGEVVVSEKVWKMVNKRCEGVAKNDSDWHVKRVKNSIKVRPTKTFEISPMVEKALRCFIQKNVQIKIDSFHISWLAELRQTSVIFIKLSGLTYNPKEDLKLLVIHNVLRSMQEVVFRFEGMVRQFLVDDKGTVLIAVFGVPPYKHIDDPIRAIKTALEISESLEKRSMHHAIGITTGSVFCGSVGSERRQEYAMVGDTVKIDFPHLISSMNEFKHSFS